MNEKFIEELYDLCKIELRISNDMFKDDIVTKIKYTLMDLKNNKIDIDNNTEMVKVAVVLNVKGLFGYDNKDAEKYLNLYENVKLKLYVFSAGDGKGAL